MPPIKKPKPVGRPAIAKAGIGAAATPGAPYSVQKAPGGVWHTYPGGRRVFVRAGNPQPRQAQAARGAATAAAGAYAPVSQSAATQQASDASFIDSEYAADQARALKARQDRQAELTAEDAGDETNYREALRRFREQQPRQLRNNLVSANRQGLAVSTVRAEGDADTIIQNQRQETDMSGARAERAAAREAARRVLEQGGTVEDAARLAAAADRKINYYEDRAEEGSLALNAPASTSSMPQQPGRQVAPPPARMQKPPAPKGFKTVVKNGRVLRYYGAGRNTRKVDVRAASKRPTRRAR